MLIHSNLGKRGMKATFDNFKVNDDNRYAFGKAVSWVTSFALAANKGDSIKGLLFYGPTGVGKTHLACAIANDLILKFGVYTYFMPTVRIPRQDTGEVLKLTDPTEIPVLVLDDVGAEKLTARALECLYILIDGRLWTMAPMIVTTNFKPEDLRTRLEGEDESGYGDRLVGRLHESCELVPIGGDDYRQKL